jgi:pyroglutamyl-peptidase
MGTLFVTGFGPFPGVRRNPSREIAFALAERRGVPGARIVAAELPVTFGSVAAAIDAALGDLEEPPRILLGLGVWSRGDGFRLERRARGKFDPARPDNEGATGAGLDLGPERATALDVAELAARMTEAGVGPVRVSDDAGGYVCERTYLHLLTRAEELGADALFLHVPPLEVLDLELQIQAVTALARALMGGLRAG